MAGAPSEMTETTDRLIATPTAYRDPAGIQDKVLPACLPKGLAVVSAGSSSQYIKEVMTNCPRPVWNTRGLF